MDEVAYVSLGYASARDQENSCPDVPLVEAVSAFGLLVFLQYAIAWLQQRYPKFGHAITAPPTLLFFRGEIVASAMSRERVTEADLQAAVRKHGPVLWTRSGPS